MYIYNDDFIFITSIKNITSIKFVKSNNRSRYVDPNNRCLIIEYTHNDKFSDLKYPGFSNLSNNLIESKTYLVNDKSIIINGILYRHSTDINFISSYIIDGSKLDISSNILYQNKSIIIVLNSNEITNWNIDDYIKFINSSEFLKCEVIDKNKFSFSNFEAVDTKYSINEVFDNSKYKYYDWKFYIDESDIVSSFIDYLVKEFPEYDISPGITDTSLQKQKTKILIYNAKLADGQSEFASRIIQDPRYGKLIQVKINIGWEFITDDLKEYINFKNKLTINHELFSKTKFKLTKNDVDWWYTINWLPDLSVEIERSPQAKLLSDTLLYNMPFNCELIGWLVLDNVDAPTILYPINRFYTDTWKLIGAKYDKSDPNVVFSFIGVSDEYNFILKECKDGSIYLTRNDLDKLSDEGYFIKFLDGKYRVFDSNGVEVTSLIIGPVKNKVMDPIQMKHGEYIVSSNATHIYKSDNLIVQLEKTDSGELVYVINLNNYINNTSKFRK